MTKGRIRFHTRCCLWSLFFLTLARSLAGCGGGSSPQTPAPPNPPALNPQPSISSLSPSNAPAGASFTLMVNGTGFVSSSVVRWSGNDRPTTFVSNTQLQAAISAGDTATTGTFQVTAFNPAPGGGISNTLDFQVSPLPNPQPSISSLSPSSAPTGGAGFTLIVNGADFLSSSVVRWSGNDRPTTFVSNTQLQAAISAGDTAAAGTAQLTVFNPAPGGGTSNALNFLVLTPAGQFGQWEGPLNWPTVAVHMALLQTGRVLVLDGPPVDAASAVRVWDPATRTFLQIPNSLSNLFCSGHVSLPDGRLIVVGGHTADFVGISGANLFDPATQRLAPAAPMTFPRWYPTATTLPDGRVLAVSGSQTARGDNALIPEVYDPANNTWTQLSNAPLALPLYPFMFVLPDGRVLEAGSDEASIPTRVLDVARQTWTMVDPNAVDAGSAVMYLPGKVMKSGSPGDVDLPNVASVATTFVLDMVQPSPRWRQTSSMSFPRAHHNLTLLPDGTVLVTGGGRNTGGTDLTQAVLEAEIWSLQTEQWTTMAKMQVPRLYHSTALLLPDARVLVAGGGRFAPATDQPFAEIFSPPYLFRGPRPVISFAPGTIGYGSNLAVQAPDASRIASVTLVRPGAVTHSYNQDQRFLRLSFQQASGSLTVTAPANANLAPPGYYMLFLVNTDGVPSLASFVKLQ